MDDSDNSRVCVGSCKRKKSIYRHQEKDGAQDEVRYS